MLPPPYVFPPLGGAVYWLAGGPRVSSSAPPQQNIVQVVGAANQNSQKPMKKMRNCSCNYTNSNPYVKSDIFKKKNSENPTN